MMACNSDGPAVDHLEGPTEPKKSRPFSSPISGAMQKIFLIEDVDIRSNHEGRTYGVTYVLAKTTSFKQLHEVLIPARYIAKFSSSNKKFLMIRGYSQNEQGQIRILESSMVLDTVDTKIADSEIATFLNPPVQEIAAVKTKEKGQRVSIKGTVERVSSVLETGTSKRKIITIKDQSGSIEIKLWGNMVNLAMDCELDQTVLLSCLTLDLYLNRASLNSNPSTTLEVLNEEEHVNGIIEAACFDEDELSILVKDHLWKMEGHLMQTIFPLGEFSPNMMLKAITRGRNIVEISSIELAEEE